MKNFGLILIAVLLTSCSSYYASNAEKSYLKSKNGRNVVVPPPLSTAEMSHFYDLPAQNQKAEVNINPPQSK